MLDVRSVTRGSGDDTDLFGRNDGNDTIHKTGECRSSDVLKFDQGISADQLWFGVSVSG